jgi:hypothetical protein
VSDNVTFQTAVTATPPNATQVATDNIGGAHFQRVKIVFGDDGTAYSLAYGTPLPLGTLPGGTVVLSGTAQWLGTVQVHGTAQALGTYQPLAGSVHPAAALPGTSHITGTVQPLAGSVHLASPLPGTVQALGTVQPLAGSVHIASPLAGGTVSIAGSVWGGTFTLAGTAQTLGTVQPLAGSVHLASRLPGTADIGTIAGTVQVLGTTQPLAGSVHLANAVPGGTVSIAGSVWGGTFFLAGTAHIGSVQRLAGGTLDSFTGTAQTLGTVDLQRAGASAVTNVAATGASVTLLASNAARKGASIFNDGDALLYVKLGASASPASYTVRMPPYSFYELPIPTYTGILDGTFAALGGTARITELSA